MGNGVSRVDIGQDAHVSSEVAGGVFFRSVALIQNDLGFDTSLVSINQSLGDVLAGKTICLNQYLLFGSADFCDDGIRASTVRAEVEPCWVLFSIRPVACRN